MIGQTVRKNSWETASSAYGQAKVRECYSEETTMAD